MLAGTIGQYQVVQHLGSGAMGNAALVRDRAAQGDRRVLKRFRRPGLAREAVAQLRRQFLLQRQIRHPNVARVHDILYDEQEGAYVVATEYVPGCDILEATRGKSHKEVLGLFFQMLRGLAHLHSLGLVHGNLKPSNILVSQTGGGARVKLVDLDPGDFSGPCGRAGSPSCDLKSLGGVAASMLHGLPAGAAGSEEERAAGILRDFVERLLGGKLRSGFSSARDAVQSLKAEAASILDLEIIEEDDTGLLTGRFVGRDRELCQLEEVAHRVLHGEGGALVFLEGSSGMGKSRMLAELKVLAQLSGIHVISTACHQESSGPLAPIRDILREILLTLEPDQEILRRHSPVLAQILPDLEQEEDPGSLPELPPEQRWIRIQNRVVEFLTGVGEIRPLLILVDEFQWIDEASLSLLDSFAGGVSGAPVIVIGALDRSLVESAGTAPSLTGVLGAEGREIITLKALPQEAVGELVRSVFSLPGKEDEISGLVTRLSGGVPLFIEELLRSLLQGGKRAVADEGLLMTGELGEPSPSEGVRQLVKSRLERLGPEARRVLEALAVFEAPVSVEMTAHVAGLSVEACAQAGTLLDGEALIWSRHFQDGTQFEIRNALIRHAVLEGVDRQAVRCLHDRSLQFLESMQAEGVTVRSAEVAYHALRSSSQGQALRHAMLAAKEAADLHAFDRARRYWRAALEKSEELGDLDRMGKILSSMAETEERLGEVEEALHSLERLRGMDPASVKLLVRIGDLHRMQGRYDEAEQTLSQALELAEAEGQLQVCRVERAIANCLYRRGRYEESLGRLQKAASVLESHGETLELARTMTTIGLIHWYQGDLDQAQSSHKEGLALYLDLGDQVGVATSYVNIGLVLWNRGRLKDALSHYRKAECIARHVGHYLIIAVALHNRGIIEFEMGALEDARRTLTSSLQMRRRLQDRAGQSKAMDTLGLVHLHAGRYGEALRLIRESIAGRDRLGDRHGTANSQVNLGLVYLDLWELKRARELFLAASKAAESLGARSVLGEALLGLAEVAVRQGDPGEGQALAFKARGVFKRLGQEPDIAQADLLLVRLTLEGQGPAFPRQRLARALRSLRRSGTAWLAAQARFLCGRVRGRRGGLHSLGAALLHAERSGFRELCWRIQLNLGEILLEEGSKPQAARRFKQGMLLLRDLSAEIPEEFLEAYFLDPDKQRLKQALSRSMALLEVPAP